VRMRSRKPWVLARRRLFGWKVRLLTTTPQLLEDKDCGQRRTNGAAQSFPGYTAKSESNRAAAVRQQSSTSAGKSRPTANWCREIARTYPVENLDGSPWRC
jgi:hypothetical protein